MSCTDSYKIVFHNYSCEQIWWSGHLYLVNVITCLHFVHIILRITWCMTSRNWWVGKHAFEGPRVPLEQSIQLKMSWAWWHCPNKHLRQKRKIDPNTSANGWQWSDHGAWCTADAEWPYDIGPSAQRTKNNTSFNIVNIVSCCYRGFYETLFSKTSL